MVQSAYYQMAMATLLSCLVWVGVSIYQATIKPAEVEVEKGLLTPLDPSLDQTVIERLMRRVPVEQSVPKDDTINGNGEE